MVRRMLPAVCLALGGGADCAAAGVKKTTAAWEDTQCRSYVGYRFSSRMSALSAEIS